MGDGSRLTPRFDVKGKSRASTPSNGDILALDLGAAEEGTSTQGSDAFMQMQLVEQQVRRGKLSSRRVDTDKPAHRTRTFNPAPQQ